jgi:hypothetical protein
MFTSSDARSPLFVVATASGGKITWTFEPSDARIWTFPLLRSTSVTSPVIVWWTPPAAATEADGADDVTTTGDPVDDGNVVVVVPGVL